MRIPAAVGDRDEPDARLDQPPRQQAALAERVPPVAVAEPRIFRVDVERLLGVGGRDQVIGLLVERVGGLRAATGPSRSSICFCQVSTAWRTFIRCWNRPRSTPPASTTSRTVKFGLDASPGKTNGLYWSPRNPATPPPNRWSI